jgi:hypothetical protein
MNSVPAGTALPLQSWNSAAGNDVARAGLWYDSAGSPKSVVNESFGTASGGRKRLASANRSSGDRLASSHQSRSIVHTWSPGASTMKLRAYAGVVRPAEHLLEGRRGAADRNRRQNLGARRGSLETNEGQGHHD